VLASSIRDSSPAQRSGESAESVENTQSTSYFATEEYVSQSRRYFREMASIYPEGFNEKLMMTADAFVTFRVGLQLALPYFLHRLALKTMHPATAISRDRDGDTAEAGPGSPLAAGFSTTQLDTYQNTRKFLGMQLERAVEQLREDCPALQRIRAKGSDLRMRDVIEFCEWLLGQYLVLG